MLLDKITIVVDDYDRAIEFFTGILGFDLAEDSPALTNDGRPKRWVVVRPPVVGQRRRVFGQVESEDAREEIDGPVIVIDDDRDLVQQHAREPTSGDGAGHHARPPAEAKGRSMAGVGT